MKSKNTNKISSQGKKIMTRAKQIRKSNPGMKWTNCVKKAAQELKK